MRRLLRRHLLAHSSAERMVLAFRATLPGIPPQARPEATRRFYKALHSTLDAGESTPSYRIDEVLGAAAMYRLWIEAR
ncbi:MAG TPA: hypothetical protein VGE94_07400 [Chloroflexota bacterium]